MTRKQTIQQDAKLTLAHNTYGQALNRHAFFRVHNLAASEDLVQDTFLKTWRYLVKGGKIELMRAFLYHVLNDLIIDEYRKRKTSSLDVMLENGFEPTTGEPEKLFSILDGKAAALMIRDLPEKYRKIMRMRYVQEMTIKEISLITGQSKNTIAVQTHRGLDKLRKLYNRQ
jgi:RNA polymerase sigma-70 factor (ECF subfamily)